MYLRVIDGAAVFPKYLLRCALDREALQRHRGLRRFQIEADGVVCYSDDERQQAEDALAAAGVSYMVEPQTIDQALVEKASGVRYASRSEAVEHLVNDVQPESLRLPNLLKRLAAVETSGQEHDARLRTLESDLTAQPEAKDSGMLNQRGDLEQRIAALEAWARTMGYTR